jgi:ABC-type taurine transport system ATPase subunit
LETATVRESLRFSAMLRQPKSVSKKEKYDYVEEVIKMLNMADFANAVVGVPGEGLNVEQRKLLTIGVELAAKPKLLLFLDEPTSGLDSQVSNTSSSIWTFTNPLAEFMVNYFFPQEAVVRRTGYSLHHPSAKRHSIPRVRPTPLPRQGRKDSLFRRHRQELRDLVALLRELWGPQVW